ncbi:MAG UNVERIFIED_CONTAM: hypothetical protein LVR18_51915 [Planctomycetaceae bacterium]
MLSLLPPGLQIVCPPAAAPLLASLQSSTHSLSLNSSRFSAPVSKFESIPGHADWILYTASTDLVALQRLLTDPRRRFCALCIAGPRREPDFDLCPQFTHARITPAGISR